MTWGPGLFLETQWCTQGCTQLGKPSSFTWNQPVFKTNRWRPRRVYHLWVTTATLLLFALEHPGADAQTATPGCAKHCQTDAWRSPECCACTSTKKTKTSKCSVFSLLRGGNMQTQSLQSRVRLARRYRDCLTPVTDPPEPSIFAWQYSLAEPLHTPS